MAYWVQALLREHRWITTDYCGVLGLKTQTIKFYHNDTKTFVVVGALHNFQFSSSQTHAITL